MILVFVNSCSFRIAPSALVIIKFDSPLDEIPAKIILPPVRRSIAELRVALPPFIYALSQLSACATSVEIKNTKKRSIVFFSI